MARLLLLVTQRKMVLSRLGVLEEDSWEKGILIFAPGGQYIHPVWFETALSTIFIRDTN